MYVSIITGAINHKVRVGLDVKGKEGEKHQRKHSMFTRICIFFLYLIYLIIFNIYKI